MATAALETNIITHAYAFALKREDNLSLHLQIFLLHIHISFTSLASHYYLTLHYFSISQKEYTRRMALRASALLFHHTLSAHTYMYMQSQLWGMPRFRSLAMQVQEDSAFPQAIRSHVTKNNTFLQNLHQHAWWRNARTTHTS